MESRWLLLGFGLLFGVLLLVHIYQGNTIHALIAVCFTTFGLGGFWWNTTHENTIETRFSRSS
ncbi:hypothetical protein BRD20_03880 [Halobacteriales archaeon SW_8_65_20]|nr:MAG: hypothetical protein BRC71_00695 [Halobacteriales archaeon QH_7_65_31]PSQ53324.1 MAG: hypothetical protein BRD20_03880 [Halobacteriales archaeon SW_8_65_20]